MTHPSFTKAQVRALRWLPADGTWSDRMPRSTASAVHGLMRAHPGLVDIERRKGGAVGGIHVVGRLTQAGQRGRADLDAQPPTPGKAAEAAMPRPR